MFRGNGPAFGGGRIAGIESEDGAEHGDRGILLEQILVFEPRQPTTDSFATSRRECSLPVQQHEPIDPFDVEARLRVVDRQLGHAVRLAPLGGADVQRTDELGLTTLQLGAQQVAEQVVIPIPLAVAVECDEQKVRMRERFEGRTGTGAVEHRIAERPAHSIEHGRSSQERDFGIREIRKQFGAEILRHQPVVAGERDAGVLPRATGFQCECGKVQPDRPSFGAVEQLVHLGVSKLYAGGIEQRAPLESRHRELVDTDFHDVTAGAKPRHGKRRFGARSEREPRAAREVERKFGDRVEALIVLQRLDVVEDEDDGFLHF